MTSDKGKQIIENGWKSAGIVEAVTNGTEGLEPLDPFASIDPLDVPSTVDEMFKQTQPNIGDGEHSNFISSSSDSDDEWVEMNAFDDEPIRNIFEVFNDDDEEETDDHRL